jgi:hypothetical protein
MKYLFVNFDAKRFDNVGDCFLAAGDNVIKRLFFNADAPYKLVQEFVSLELL